MTELMYNPPFVPGDILKIDGFTGGNVYGLVMGSRDAGVISEILAKHPVRDYQILLCPGVSTQPFVFALYNEETLLGCAEKVGHLDYGEMTCSGTDILEVLDENQNLKKRLDNMTEARDFWRAEAERKTT